MKYEQIGILTNIDAAEFHEHLAKKVSNYQNQNLEVEIKLQTNITTDNQIMYTALILAGK